MLSPDIIGVEEMENLSNLQAIASKVNNDSVAAGQPNPNYVAYLVEGNDPGGIDSGFLVKSSRVTVIDVVQQGKDATYINPDTNASDLLNDRPPLILRATIKRSKGSPFHVTVIVNHLRSLSGINGTDGNRIRIKRRCQLCGRARAVYRKFGICRICFRNMASNGLIPGVQKASW